MSESSHPHQDTRLKISFPKSSEDHRLQLIEINGSIFAIFYSELESNGPINLHCEEWSLFLLAPIKSKADIQISGKNIFCFNEIQSEEASVNVHAANRLVKMTPLIQPQERLDAWGKKGESDLTNDPSTFFNYFQALHKIVTQIHEKTPESFAEAQNTFLTILYALAGKVEGKMENLNIHRVLGIWDIPPLTP